ncbi:MAG: hypothetical protein QG555_1546 [Thermodesulfobacteriota bacterium]|nr:hypothetical protein [Thermodesulfobacteriota bacterium]
MDYQALLQNRRAIRDFQDRELPLSILKEMLQETCLAPTASNGQPCRFIIIRDREFMQRLSTESKDNLLADVAANPALQLKKYEAVLRDERFNIFYNAPCVVYFVGPKAVGSLDVDTALTAAYFMFAATARGLGTCWIGMGTPLRAPEILKEMGMPEDCEIVAPIIVGYPTDTPAASERHDPAIIRVI